MTTLQESIGGAGYPLSNINGKTVHVAVAAGCSYGVCCDVSRNVKNPVNINIRFMMNHSISRVVAREIRAYVCGWSLTKDYELFE